MAGKVFSILKKHGIEVIGFIDSDEKKKDNVLFEKKIYDKDIIMTLHDDIVIIENARKYFEIENIIKSKRDDLERFYIAELPFELDRIWVDREKHRGIRMWPIVQLGEYYSHEHIDEILLYGNDLQLAEKYAEVFECLGFQSLSFVTEKGEEDGIISIDEVVYKYNYLLLWYEEDDNYVINKLIDVGVEKRYYAKIITEGSWYLPNTITRNVRLDVNLGYTYETNSEYPGIYLYGENQKNDYKIAVLGDSTTDSLFDTKIRSWVEIMYDQYCGANVTIFNGGTSGYNSAMELLKLIRDILKLNPDMVIVFGGFNDLVQQGGPDFPYLEKLVNYAGKYMPEPWHVRFKEKEAWRGISSDRGSIDNWLENIENMHTLSASRNIEFFAFMQPMLYTKKTLDSHSKTILYQTPLYHKQSFMQTACRFRKYAKEIEQKYGYIYDLTYIFDDVDVYMDISHVYESGNKIIAEHIWNAIKEKVGVVQET